MSQVIQLKGYIVNEDGAGRGNRTPMELLPTDFESAASASNYLSFSIIEMRR